MHTTTEIIAQLYTLDDAPLPTLQRAATLREVSLKGCKIGYSHFRFHQDREGWYALLARRDRVQLVLGIGPDRASAIDETVTLLTEEL